MTSDIASIDIVDVRIWMSDNININLTDSQARIFISMCSIADDIIILNMARNLKISNNTIMRAAKKLELLGFAERISNPHDGRSVFLRPTVRAMALYDRIVKELIT